MAQPLVVVHVQGGNIQSITANMEVQVIVMDADNTDQPGSEDDTYTFLDRPSEAFRCHAVNFPVDVDESHVEQILAIVEGDAEVVAICQNCEGRWSAKALEVTGASVFPHIPHLGERVAPGERVPYCECPACGALCHVPSEAER